MEPKDSFRERSHSSGQSHADVCGQDSGFDPIREMAGARMNFPRTFGAASLAVLSVVSRLRFPDCFCGIRSHVLLKADIRGPPTAGFASSARIPFYVVVRSVFCASAACSQGSSRSTSPAWYFRRGSRAAVHGRSSEPCDSRGKKKSPGESGLVHTLRRSSTADGLRNSLMFCACCDCAIIWSPQIFINE